MKFSQLYQNAPGEGGLAELLGADEVYEENGSVCVTLPLKESLLNHSSTVHGGALAALVDIGVGAFHKWHSRPAVVLESHVSYLRAAKMPTVLTVCATPQKLGKTVSVFQVQITDSDGALIATAGVSTFRKK